MYTIYLVTKHEIITTIGKRSFWVMTFLFPGIILALSVGMQAIGTKAIEEAEAAASSVEQANRGLPVGYVDHSDILVKLPDWVPAGYLQSFPSESAASSALAAGDINQFYIIPANFLETGEFSLVDKNYQPLRSSGNAKIFENILDEVLIERDPLGKVLLNPTTRIDGHAQAPPSGIDEDDPFSYIVPMSTLFIFFFVISTSGGFLLNSVTKEKENRTAETLLVSLEPRQLMTGKVVGLGLIALFQMSIWLGGAIFAINKGNQLQLLTNNVRFPPGFFFWAVAFFLFGYFLYGSILGSIGVLAPNAREGGQFTFLAILPLLIPLWFNYTFTKSPDGALSIFLSIFPLTAPSSMITRLSIGSVPLWQLLLSLVFLAMTAFLFVILSARLFRADNFLSSESLNWKRFITEIQSIRSK